MPLIIEELSTELEVRDEVKLRRVVREEIDRYFKATRGRVGAAAEIDPADPAAAGKPTENGR